MPTLQSLIRENWQRPIRRIYIKRRAFSSGAYEADWVRADRYRGTDRTISFGSASIEIDHQPGQVMAFDASELQLVMDNQEGTWNIETDENSIWYPDSTYLNRKFTKLKVETGYLAPDGTEVGVENTFEGVISRVVVGEDQKAMITVLSYHTILQKYSISDLSMTGAKTVSQIVDLIMNQSKITQFIPFVASAPTVNTTVTDSATLEGTYWDVIKSLSLKSNSIPMLIGSQWSFASRTPGSNVWDFYGSGTQQPDIFSVLSYDDEGADRVRVFWKDENSSTYAQSSNTVLLRKYLGEPEIINLDSLSTPDKQLALDSLLTEWEAPKPVIEFSTRFMVNLIKPLDTVTIKIFGQLSPLNVGRWGSGTWGDGDVWGKVKGAVNILGGGEWVVTRVTKDFDSWVTIIKAEKVV